MTYAGTGVDYDAMDPAKRAFQLAARTTRAGLEALDFEEAEWTRGESAYLFRDRTTGRWFGHVHEGLGTKNKVAEAVTAATGVEHFDRVAQCTVAMGVNDLITLGALPLTVAMHLAVGHKTWFDNQARIDALARGWAEACRLAGAAWSGGETPTLRDIVLPGTCELSCSVTGALPEGREPFSPDLIRVGDVIVILPSSGVHANGITLARDIAELLQHRWETLLPGGRPFGEAILSPTSIYSPVIAECHRMGLEVHYGVNITGHGYRKLMRARQPFRYVLDTLPEPQPEFRLIQEVGKVDDREMYGNYNMGGGFALYVPERSVEQLILASRRHGIEAFRAGRIEASDERSVALAPLGIEYGPKDLELR